MLCCHASHDKNRYVYSSYHFPTNYRGQAIGSCVAALKFSKIKPGQGDRRGSLLTQTFCVEYATANNLTKYLNELLR